MNKIKDTIKSYNEMQEFIEYKNKMAKEILNENGTEFLIPLKSNEDIANEITKEIMNKKITIQIENVKKEL